MDTGVVAIAFFGVRGHSFEDNEYRAAHVALAIVSALKRYDLRAKCGVTVGVGFWYQGILGPVTPKMDITLVSPWFAESGKSSSQFAVFRGRFRPHGAAACARAESGAAVGASTRRGVRSYFLSA